MATVFKLDLDEKYDGYAIPHLAEIFKQIPKLKDIIKPGDIIENSIHSGYRGSGSYVYDKSKLVQLKDVYDDYPCIPVWIFFKYNLPWNHYDDENLIFNNEFTEDKTQSFYLHSEQTSNAIGYYIIETLKKETLKKMDEEVKTLCLICNNEEEINDSLETLKYYFRD